MPIQILAQAKAKEPPTDALPTFASIYKNLHKIGSFTKENISGKFIDEWNKSVGELEKTPEVIDMSLAVSALLAVKDEEELVRI